MTEHSPKPWPWLLAVLFVASWVPLLVFDLNGASQLAGALALPVSVFLAALPQIPATGRSGAPVPWRRYSLIAAVVLALVGTGAVGYAVWDNTRDIPVTFPGGQQDAPTWRHMSFTRLEVPGAPPARNRLTISVSLRNAQTTGDCEHTASLDFTPILDGREKSVITGVPGQSVIVPIDGAQRDAAVQLTLRYDAGNDKCLVHLHIDKAVLHD